MAGGVSKQSMKERTGKSLDQWLAYLEAEADISWSLDRVAGLLTGENGLEAEWAEAIAAAYGQKLGRKPVGQTKATGFQIGVRRTLPHSPEQLWRLLVSPEGLKLWLGGMAEAPLSKGQAYVGDDGTTGEMRVVRPMQQLRLTWRKPGWERASTLQIRLLPAASGKTTISFHQENLDDLFVREEMKSRWEQAAARLAEMAAE